MAIKSKSHIAPKHIVSPLEKEESDVVLKEKVIIAAPEKEQEVPAEEKLTKTTVYGKKILSQYKNDAGLIQIIDEDRTGYTLPLSEYEVVCK